MKITTCTLFSPPQQSRCAPCIMKLIRRALLFSLTCTGPDTKGNKNSKAKPEKDMSSDEGEEEEEVEEENGGAADAKMDTKNGANNKTNSNKKPEGPMALGEIAFIDSKITSTKIDGLQPLYNVSVTCRPPIQPVTSNCAATD